MAEMESSIQLDGGYGTGVPILMPMIGWARSAHAQIAKPLGLAPIEV